MQSLSAERDRARLAVVICSYNRAESLLATLSALYFSYQGDELVDVRVVANACTDNTLSALEGFRRRHAATALNLAWVEEPTPGKSHALNAALREFQHEALCFVDDDQLPECGFLDALLAGLTTHPEDDILCGRLWPAWDGSEPPWVHVSGPWAIPIRPFPEFDLGPHTMRLPPECRLPSGGNITVRRRVFSRIGGFSNDLGPRGHDLAGGEDHEFLTRARAAGFQLRYLPGARQRHVIDSWRMSTPYILKKSYLRSRSNFLIHEGRGPRPYMARKIFGYGARAISCLDSNRRFYYGVRLAAALGELSGAVASLGDIRTRGHGGRISISDSASRRLCALGFLTTLFGVLALLCLPLKIAVPPVLGAAGLSTLALATRSLLNFSRTGPRLRKEVLSRYRAYSVYAFARLTMYALTISLLLGAAGAGIYAQLGLVFGWPWFSAVAFVAALCSIVLALLWRLSVKLLYNPGLVIASIHYLPSRLYPLWRTLSPTRLQTLRVTGMALLMLLAGLATWRLVLGNASNDLIALWAGIMFYFLLIRCAEEGTVSYAESAPARSPDHPNILMLGCDTLRADVLGRGLTPNLDRLTRQGTWFTQCYVPCARTAPSLVSLFTARWPTAHGVRDNFVADDEVHPPFSTLPRWLAPQGYRSAALSDWCGGDVGKFDFGFDLLDLPEDQWNLKYLIRQGPKDLRLFLSLFLHNGLGRLFLPEIYYQGGVPLTTPLGQRARRLVSHLARKSEPFLLNIFYSTTHPPFASEWPWYTRYADPGYAGESKFAMARLTDPMDVLRRQGEPREDFDLEQVLHLYDGCVARLDHEVGLMLDHLERSGLAQNTVVAIYSDHGMEFFEHGTWGQGNSAVGEASSRIPLIVLDPRRPGAGRVDQVVRSIDLAPTLAELAGARLPRGLDGVSLVPLVNDPGRNLRLPAYNETGIWLTKMPGQAPEHLTYPDVLELLEVPNLSSGTLALKPAYRRLIIEAKDRMLRLGPWKLVYQPMNTGSRLLLFNLEDDPACMHDVAENYPTILNALWEHLHAWLDADSLRGRVSNSTAQQATESPV